MDEELKRSLRRYPLYFLLWTGYGLFYFSQGLTQRLLSRDAAPWWHYLGSWLTGVYIWALLTPGLLWLGRRFPLERAQWPRRVALHLALGVAVSVVQLTLEAVVTPYLGFFPTAMGTFRSALRILLIRGVHGGALTYWTVLAVQWGFHYYRGYEERHRQALALELRAAGLESQLVRAQLGALKAQLQPHFLFNTLNAIVVLVRQHRVLEAEEMLGQLSDLLRSVLDDVEAQEVPLRRELEYLRLYLSIEQARFKDRLRVEIAADASVLEAAVPPMGLQPIVENAIRHGIGRSSAAGRLHISASRSDGTLRLRVQDDGPGFLGGVPADGVGIANTRARLRQLYGEKGSLTLENGGGGGAVVTMTLPCRVAPPLAPEPR
jgi:signal transduction histidine kinase